MSAFDAHYRYAAAMKIIDLSKTLEHGMSVYPGDPPVHIRVVQSIASEDWVLRQLRMGSHTGTHVDAPSHMHEEGTALDKLPLDRFIGKAHKVKSAAEAFPKNVGLLFEEGEIDSSMLEKLLEAQPPFIAMGDKAELSLELEKALLEKNILTFTDLINLAELPFDTEFTFFGVPLKIKNGDGSPVRAFAIL